MIRLSLSLITQKVLCNPVSMFRQIGVILRPARSDVSSVVVRVRELVIKQLSGEKLLNLFSALDRFIILSLKFNRIWHNVQEVFFSGGRTQRVRVEGLHLRASQCLVYMRWLRLRLTSLRKGVSFTIFALLSRISEKACSPLFLGGIRYPL